MDEAPGIPAAPIRRRTTSRRVYLADRVSAAVITLGGLVVILAVLGIGVYLVSVTAALFLPGRTAPAVSEELPAEAPPLFIEPDDSRAVALRLLRDGRLQTIDLRTAKVVSERRVTPEGAQITAFARTPRGGGVALGYADGRIGLGTISFTTGFLDPEHEPAALHDLAIGETRPYEDAVAERTPIKQVRLTRARVELARPARLRTGKGAVTFLDYHIGASEEFVAAMRADGSMVFNTVRRRANLTGGPARVSLRSHAIPASLIERDEAPAEFLILGNGSGVLLIWRDGFAERIVMDNPETPVVAESAQLVDKGRTVTSVAKLIGGRTIVVGDSGGGVAGWFAARNELARTPDHRLFVRAHRLAQQGAAITSVGVSTRDRTFITGDASGAAWVRNMTSGATIARVRAEAGEPVAAARLAPKVDGVMLLTASGRLDTWSLEAPNADVSVASLFGRVWYEGDPAPSYTYQSSSGDDAAEAKYNLVPLIVGTLKATIYTMILAIPFGILAAIYTSEFLSRRLRTAIKPSIEMMASLPSVVLGFIAAMTLAPMIRDALPGVLLAFIGVPVGVLLGAYLWHFAPVRVVSRVSAGGRLAMILLVTVFAGWVSIRLGPALESVFFRPSATDVLLRAGSYEPLPRDGWPAWLGGVASVGPREVRRLRAAGLSYRDGAVVRPVGSLDDPELARRIALHGFDRASMRAWLDGVIGGAWPGWFLLLFPASALLVAVLLTRLVDPALRAWDRAHAPAVEALVELGKFLLALAATVGLAAGVALLLTAVGLDPRDSIFGSYQQRNTMVVALVMAVAVIPIIYTITDDAMASVPDALRSASFGAGATRWQTAVRVVLPVALSGVFSACMIGFGRAAGETMIVLMATGNTPIMSWSLFDGLRSLSANIAVELPEAPKGGTHYRVLFLCGLVLFVMTFAINTAAELIRQRVRRRMASL